MALKSQNINQLRAAIEATFGVTPDTTQIGKAIFRIQDLTCTLFSNGTVMFQGQDSDNKIEMITRLVKEIG